MRRRISMLLAAVLTAAGFVMLSPTQPASALVTCAGTGTATVAPGILYPVSLNTPGKNGLVADILIGDLTTNPTYGFTFGSANIVCAHVHSNGTVSSTDKVNQASGTVLGYCGLSSGKGRLNNQALFAFVGIGGLLVITGHVVGVVAAIPDTLAGESCAHGPTTVGGLPAAGALKFMIAGAIVLLNCTNLPPTTEYLRQIVLVDVLTPELPVHVKIHLTPHIFVNQPCVPGPNDIVLP